MQKALSAALSEVGSQWPRIRAWGGWHHPALQSLELGFPWAELLQPPSGLDPPACIKSACDQAWLLGSRDGSRPASLRALPSTGGSVSPGCLPWTRAGSAGPAPGWCQLQGKCWSRQLSAGLPLHCGREVGGRERAWGGRRGNHFQGRPGWAGLGLAHPPTQDHLCLLAQAPSHLASASPGCSPGPPTAATPSRPCGGLQLPGRGPSWRGSQLGTGSLH